MRATGGLNVVWLGPDAVIKAYAPRDADEAAVERDALRAVDGRLPVPVPRVLADGAAHDGWTWLAVTRLAGRPALAAWPRLDTAARRRCVAAVAELLTALHRIEPPPRVRARRLPFDAWLAAQWPDTRARHLHEGLPPALVDAFEAFVLGGVSAEPAVFAHGDLHDENLLVDANGTVTGLLDFGDAAGAPASFDLVSPLLHLAREDAVARRALLAAIPVDPEALLRVAVGHPWAEVSLVRPRTLDDVRRIVSA